MRAHARDGVDTTTTSHSSLLVARQGDVFCKHNQAFLLVDLFNFNSVDEERSDIYDLQEIKHGEINV